MKNIANSVLICAAALSLLACHRPDPIRIGFVAGLTGKTADLGEASRNGALLAAEEINQKGGINGRMIELIVKDDAFDAATAEKVSRELIEAKVDLIVGPVNSAMAKAMLPVANQYATTMISPTITGMEFVGIDDYLLRLNITTRDNANFYAEHHFHKKGRKNIAVIYDQQNSAFSESWLGEFRTAFTRVGGRIAAEIPLDTSKRQPYLHAAVAALAARPDAILMINPPVDTARLAQQLRQLAAKVPLITSEWGGSEQLIEMGGRAVEGMAVVQAYDRDDPSERYQNFKRAYQTRFKLQPSYPSVATYDTVSVAIQALSKRKPDQDIKTALLQNGPYQILQQTIEFDQNGDTQRNVFFKEVRNGEFRQEL
jgi:branched-chain amino acid transport system substrate-binding protein